MRTRLRLPASTHHLSAKPRMTPGINLHHQAPQVQTFRQHVNRIDGSASLLLSCGGSQPWPAAASGSDQQANGAEQQLDKLLRIMKLPLQLFQLSFGHLHVHILFCASSGWRCRLYMEV